MIPLAILVDTFGYFRMILLILTTAFINIIRFVWLIPMA